MQGTATVDLQVSWHALTFWIIKSCRRAHPTICMGDGLFKLQR